jgi:threonine dehydrogenase-like Zn-dependent dehydrogenase
MSGSMSHTRNAWKRALALVGEGKIRLAPLITSVYGLSEWEKGFRDFEERSGIKILIKP